MYKFLDYLKDPFVVSIICMILIFGLIFAKCIFGDPPTEEDKKLGLILSIITATF